MQTTTIVAPKVSRAVGTAFTQLGGYSPAGSIGAIVSSLVCANLTAGLILVTVTLFDGTNDTSLAFSAPVAVGDSIMVGGADAKFTLVNGWSIRVKSNVAASVDASMCVAEFT